LWDLNLNWCVVGGGGGGGDARDAPPLTWSDGFSRALFFLAAYQDLFLHQLAYLLRCGLRYAALLLLLLLLLLQAANRGQRGGRLSDGHHLRRSSGWTRNTCVLLLLLLLHNGKKIASCRRLQPNRTGVLPLIMLQCSYQRLLRGLPSCTPRGGHLQSTGNTRPSNMGAQISRSQGLS